MKAQYILEAIAAMKEADRLAYTMDPKEFGRISGRLILARSALEAHCGLNDVEVEIEKESA
jgi:hypothetical protein